MHLLKDLSIRHTMRLLNLTAGISLPSGKTPSLKNPVRERFGYTKQNWSAAVTQVSIERRKRNSQYSIALLKLAPKTGRTHQLRVQSAIRKVPIIGDRTYGNFSLNRKIAKLSKENRLFLHASEISLDIKTKQGDKNYMACGISSP